jgi:DNA-directed RNA polymerase subunit N (RpoN/RPB10)
MIYLKCPTCGTILGNRQQLYVKRLDDIEGNTSTDENTKNELKTKLFDEIKIENYCCKMRILTFKDLNNIIK